MFRLINTSLIAVSRLPICFLKAKKPVLNWYSTTVKSTNNPAEQNVEKIIYEFHRPKFFILLNGVGVLQSMSILNYCLFMLEHKNELKEDPEDKPSNSMIVNLMAKLSTKKIVLGCIYLTMFASK